MKVYKYITIFLLFSGIAGFVGSCSNPINIDSQKRITDESKPKPVTVSADSIEVFAVESTENEESAKKSFRIIKPLGAADSLATFRCSVDTSGLIPRLTLRASFVPTGQYYTPPSYALQRLNIKLDSMFIDGDSNYRLDRGQIEAVVLTYRKVRDKIVPITDTIELHGFDQYNFAFLEQHVVSGSKTLRLSLSLQVLSTTVFDNKRRVGQFQGVMKIHY